MFFPTLNICSPWPFAIQLANRIIAGRKFKEKHEANKLFWNKQNEAKKASLIGAGNVPTFYQTSIAILAQTKPSLLALNINRPLLWTSGLSIKFAIDHYRALYHQLSLSKLADQQKADRPVSSSTSLPWGRH